MLPGLHFSSSFPKDTTQIPKIRRAYRKRRDYGIGGGSRGEGEKRIIVFRGEPRQKCASPHDDSRPIAVTKTRHQVPTAERALLVGVGWKRAPRFPGMPAGEQGRESLLELVELARSAGAEIAGSDSQTRAPAYPA
jgi:50S ribosomal subunit-associated GTPase HflX